MFWNLPSREKVVGWVVGLRMDGTCRGAREDLGESRVGARKCLSCCEFAGGAEGEDCDREDD
jgi:hypothetical protein